MLKRETIREKKANLRIPLLLRPGIWPCHDGNKIHTKAKEGSDQERHSSQNPRSKSIRENGQTIPMLYTQQKQSLLLYKF